MNHQYRPDIDALRAIAVLFVIYFHMNDAGIPGGFTGVDIFFVISGYLITKIIVNEKNQTFSIINFYERRFRRILPALFIVVVVTSIASILLLHPERLFNFTKSLFANGIFSSNIYFSFTSGYFETASKFKPLLHTWSLAVEEQLNIASILKSSRDSVSQP